MLSPTLMLWKPAFISIPVKQVEPCNRWRTAYTSLMGYRFIFNRGFRSVKLTHIRNFCPDYPSLTNTRLLANSVCCTGLITPLSHSEAISSRIHCRSPRLKGMAFWCKGYAPSRSSVWNTKLRDNPISVCLTAKLSSKRSKSRRREGQRY